MHAVERPTLFSGTQSNRSMDDAPLDDELDVDDGYAADSDSRGSGEEEVDEDGGADEDEAAEEEDHDDECVEL